MSDRKLLRATRWLRANRKSLQQLDSEISSASIRLEMYEKRLENPKRDAWATAVESHIDRAKRYSANGYILAGYESLFAAERGLIAGMNSEEMHAHAISLRAEASKKLGSSWRAKAASKQLGSKSTQVNIATMQETLGHIQARSQNGYREIDLLKRQLTILGMLLGLITTVTLVVASWGHFRDFDIQFENWLGLAVLFGLMGGTLSAMFSATQTPEGIKNPEAQRSGPLTLIRCLIGGAVAIPIYVFIRSGMIEFKLVDAELTPILAFAFIGGFSERWFFKRLEQIIGVKNESKKKKTFSHPDKNSLPPGKEHDVVGTADRVISSPDTGFRLGVGAVIASEDGSVLQCRRADITTDSWQFPQGGIKEGETPEDAVKRELIEEIGVDGTHLRLEGQVENWLTYELPVKLQNAKVGRGQTQKWFLFRISALGMNLIEPNQEFSECRWVSLQQAVADVVDFRKPIYRHLLSKFAEIINKS
jgi:putative (di)nucleoside polyphosphate hydrolase